MCSSPKDLNGAQRIERAAANSWEVAPAARGDPQMVAEMIYHAVYDKEPKLRYLVGQDAEGIGGLKKQLDDTQFEQTMRQALNFWD